ncbi:MAG: hypothetical protein ACI9U2_001602 [Bradymonadia bacterium]|jgi:hypothetical protein
MVRPALIAAFALLGCQDILPLVESTGDGSMTDGSVFTLDGGTLDGGTLDGGTLDGGTLDGGTLDGGTLDGDTTDGGVDPGLFAPIPPLKPGCPTDALSVTAALADSTGFAATRRAAIVIDFEAPGASRVEFRSSVAGRIVDRTATSVTFSFSDVPDPIRGGRYAFTVLAFDADGCASSARIDLDVDGDLIIGTRRGAVWFLGSDGRVLAPINHGIADPSSVSALAIRHDPLRIALGFDHPDTAGDPTLAPLIELDLSTGARIEFALEDIQGDPLYPSGTAPYNLVWSPDGTRLWADGMRDSTLRVFHADGRHDRSLRLAEGGAQTRAVLGVFVGDLLYAATFADDVIFSIDDVDEVQVRAQVGGFDPEIRHIIRGSPNGDEETLLVLHWDGNLQNVTRLTVLGQTLETYNLGGLSTQIIRSGADLIARSTAGNVWVYRADGTNESLLTSRDFLDDIGEDFINLGALIPFE